MSFQIIIKGKNHYGKTRGEREDNLRKDGFKSMDDELQEKCKWMEKRGRLKAGFLPQTAIKHIDRIE